MSEFPLEVEYLSPWGDRWPLTSVEHRGVFIREGSLRSFMGDVERTAAAGFRGAGQRTTSLAVKPLEVGFTVCVVPGEEAERLWLDWLRSWSYTSPGTLIVRNTSLGDVRMSVWLRGVGEPDQLTNGEQWWGGYPSVEMTVAADGGLWWAGPVASRPLPSAASSQVVRVANSGDWFVRPRVRWQGAGAAVTMPSGARVTLPTTTAPRSLILDMSESCAVVDDSGVLDKGVWRRLAGGVVPEAVPPGGVREYRIEGRSQLLWRVPVLRPWR